MNDLEPPSFLRDAQLTGNPQTDAIFRTWLNNLYENVRENMASDFYLRVVQGLENGYSSVNKFGRNTAVGTSSQETIWDGSSTYSFSSSADIVSIWQVADVAANRGTQIQVEGLDTNWAFVSQTATLDGSDSSTEVALTTGLRRVFRAYSIDDTIATQNINIGTTGKAATKASILVGENQTQMAVYTVPANKTAYITQYFAALNKEAGVPPGDPNGVVKLYFIDNANSYPVQIKHSIGLDADGTSHSEHEFKPYLKATEKTDIYIDFVNNSGSSTADVSAGFDIILVDN